MKNNKLSKNDRVLVKSIIDKQNNWKRHVKRFCLVTISAFIFYIAIQWFILGTSQHRHTNFLFANMAGWALAIVNVFPVTTSYFFYLQFALSIPFLIYSFFKIGKITTAYSCLFIVIQIAYGYIPDPFVLGRVNVDSNLINYALQIISGIIAAIIGAIAMSLNYSNSSTAGGIDPLIIRINYLKKISFNRLNVIFNAVIIVSGFLFVIIGGIIKDGTNNYNYNNLLFEVIGTIIAVSGYIYFLDYIYPKNKKIAVFVVITPENKTTFKKMLNKYNFYRTFTELSGVGGYKNEPKTILLTVITSFEFAQFRAIAKQADQNAFVFSIHLTNLTGQFKNYLFD